ncbi:hypothetical protein [Butyrivibrio sp. FCS006]|uniref:hypothetical protein n=1 Tax=Butyrivibrio sp. FCS006 TaxID=1280684 RepID=UPI00040B5BA1|nr:hypothetical protein [Butyrivibrio sp. FCS006]
MKIRVRNALCILMTLMIFCAVLGSGSTSISVRAEELNSDQDFIQTDIMEDTERALDVCFFIRGAAVGADIPEEPGNYAAAQYSSAIRVDGAVSASYSESAHAVDGSEESLLSDGFTASNEVSQMLKRLPQAADIRSAVGVFDETKHYVVWYVIKSATTGYPNADVTIHVDGVIRERTIAETEDPQDPNDPQELEDPQDPKDPQETEEPQEPEKPAEVADPIPDVTLEIRALFLEDGKECKEIVFDGKEHIVGGFEIVVKDKESDNPIIGYLYECYGQFIGTKSYADNGQGTEFTYRGQDFWVNVVKAFAKVTNIGDSQEVVFYDADDHPLRSAADFIIKDSAGNILPAKFNVLPVTGTVNVKARDITVEAGTTVKNNQGQTLTDDSFTITSGSLLEGHRIEKVVINGSQTGVGRSVNEITTVIIVDENGKPVNDLYNIKKVNGELILVDPGTGESATVSGSENTSASGTTSIISVIRTNSGLTATTGNVVMDSLQAAGNSTVSQRVLGARRADTSDTADDYHIRLLVLISGFAFAALTLINGKHSN